MMVLLATTNTITVTINKTSVAIAVTEKESAIGGSMYTVKFDNEPVFVFHYDSGKLTYLTLGQMLVKGYAEASELVAEKTLQGENLKYQKERLKEQMKIMTNPVIRALQDTYFTEVAAL